MRPQLNDCAVRERDGDKSTPCQPDSTMPEQWEAHVAPALSLWPPEPRSHRYRCHDADDLACRLVLDLQSTPGHEQKNTMAGSRTACHRGPGVRYSTHGRPDGTFHRDRTQALSAAGGGASRD